jgi:hypothetical protein
MTASGSSGARSHGDGPSAGAIVSLALTLCRDRWRTLAVYGLLAGLPVGLLDAAVALQRDVDPLATPLTGDASTRSGGSLGSSLLALVLYALASAACVHTIAAAREGRRIGWREGLTMGVRHLGGVVVASVIILVLVFLGLLALVLPGIWIAVALALTTPALVLEGLTPLAAIRRSFTLVQGRWWQTAGVMGLGVLIAFAGLVIVAIPAGLLAATTDDRSLRAVIAALANGVGTGLLVPITVGLATVLFLERRGATASHADGEADSARYRGFAPPVPPEIRRPVGGTPDPTQLWADPRRPPESPDASPPRNPPPPAG